MKAAVLILLLGLQQYAEALLAKPSECGSTLGCYTDCGDTCKFVVTWKDRGTTVDFSLKLRLDSSGDQWIALGLSADQEMGTDSVTECVMKGNTVKIEKSYNPGKFNSPVSPATEGLTTSQGSATNGVLSCSYTQIKTSSNAQVFDLSTDWYLLLAYGPASEGVKRQHSVNPTPAVSPDKVDFQSTKDLSGSARSLMVRVHGSLMAVAWIFCASLGIVIARHYKPMWPNTTLAKEKVWFTLHRVCMVLALCACAAAFIIIFVDVKDWSYLPGHSNFQKAHPYLGVIVTFCVILNPIMALFRPHPDHDYRFIFSWAHWGVGTVAQVLSALVLILGVTLARSQVPFYCVWVLVAWVVYQMLMELLLEILDCCYADSSIRYYRDGVAKTPRGSRLKNILIAVHVLIITAFTAACIVIINLG